MKAIILTRVSTKMQEEGLSLLAQNNRLQDYADRKELEVIKTFEIIESSTHGERKQFVEMINFCKKQKGTIAIIADTVDRVQRSFKESVLLDELMRKDKIELHFYREGMVLNSKSTSVDSMRGDFSVMGAKAYVLQSAENVRRSNEQKNKNGEITGMAPLGYENYVDERGKKFVRPKEPDATIIKKMFEMYSLGNTSVAELAHYANIMGLKSRKGTPISVNSIYFMMDNTFYYGEMRTIRGVMPHIYKPLISKELWDLCQEQKALRAGNVGKYSQKPVVFKGMVRCGITGRTCPCEFKKGKFSYIVCWMNNKTRSYIREEYIIKQISSILNRIRLPNNVIIELQKELKSSKASEKKFYAQEIKKLRAEQDKLKEKLNNLFDLRLDGELDRESFDTKRNEIQVKMNRLKNKVSAHEKADKNFDETILGLLDIATQAGYVFEKSNNLELKRLLLKFVFESLTLTEGELTYKLRFPFNEFINSKILVTQATKSYEPMQPLAEQRLQGNDNENLQIGDIKSYELAESLKNKRLAKNFASLLQIGDPNGIRTHITTVKG